MHCHSAVSNSIAHHFLLVTTWDSEVASANKILLLVMGSLLLVALLVSLLSLALDVHWWLRPDAVLRRCWAWLLGGRALLAHHAVVKAVGDASDEVVVLLDEPERVRRWTSIMAVVNCSFTQQTLGVRTSRSFLCSSWSETTAWVVGSEASLTSLVTFSAGTATDVLPPRQHLTSLALNASHSAEGVNVESSSSHWSSRLENSKLLLVQDLWVGKSLVCRVTQMRRSNHLLGHH